MPTNDNENEKESCCSGKGRCCHCGIKVLAGIVLLLLGGVIGFLMGTHGCHGGFGRCPMAYTQTTPAK